MDYFNNAIICDLIEKVSIFIYTCSCKRLKIALLFMMLNIINTIVKTGQDVSKCHIVCYISVVSYIRYNEATPTKFVPFVYKSGIVFSTFIFSEKRAGAILLTTLPTKKSFGNLK